MWCLRSYQSHLGLPRTTAKTERCLAILSEELRIEVCALHVESRTPSPGASLRYNAA
jgi:hypothetical protein